MGKTRKSSPRKKTAKRKKKTATEQLAAGNKQLIKGNNALSSKTKVAETLERPSARDALIAFLEAWKEDNHVRMGELANPSWRLDGHPLFTESGWINSRFGYLKLLSFNVPKESTRIGEAMVQFFVKVKIKGGDMKPAKAFFNANVLCEISPYHPSLEEGEWGVNPTSVANITWG